jgi:endonuclease/exonuclease/phosphatase family metal-dependent hydrolase
MERFNIHDVERGDGEMVVMTYNIRRSNIITDRGVQNWYYRANYFMEVVFQNEPDIIGFQEVKPLQYRHLRRTLLGYDSVNEYRQETLWPESCPVFWRNDKYELVATDGCEGYGFFWLSDTPHTPSKHPEAGSFRIVTWVMLREISTGIEFAVFNTHLDNESPAARMDGLKVIFAKMDALLPADTPILFIGDMNFRPNRDIDTLEYRENHHAYEMVLARGFKDAQFEAEDSVRHPTGNGTNAGWNTNANRNNMIDIIFFTPNHFTAEKFWVDITTFQDGRVVPSDHFPAIAQLRLV